jgi:hypothetical protein
MSTNDVVVSTDGGKAWAGAALSQASANIPSVNGTCR